MNFENDYIEAFIVLILIMLWTNHKYPKNYYLQGFWILCISWFGVIVENNLSPATFDASIYIVILMLFNIMINIFYLNARFNERKMG